MSKIEASGQVLDELFGNNFFDIPNNQRDYDWSPKEGGEIRRLLSNLFDAQESEREADDRYFVGSLVFSRGRAAQHLTVIDGQQRLTTFFLILCSIYHHIGRVEGYSGDAQHLTKYLFNTTAATGPISAGRRYIKTLRIKVHYPGGNEVLEQLAATGSAPHKALEPFAQELVDAYEAITKELETTLGDDSEEWHGFLAFLLTDVEMVQIVTNSAERGVQIFENMNARGLSLTSADLVKNLLFKNVHSPDEELALKATWDVFAERMKKVKTKLSITKFLKLYLYADHATEEVTEDEVFKWFDGAAAKGLLERPSGLVKEFDHAAAAYINFMAGNDVSGKPNRFLQNLKHVKNGYLFFVLAARRFPLGQFNRLCAALENYLFVLALVNPSSQAPELRLLPLIEQLRDVNEDDEAVSKFIDVTFNAALAEYQEQFERRMLDASESTIKIKGGIRYILAKMAQEIDIRANGLSSSNERIEHYMAKSLTIEHMLPQAVKEGGGLEARAEFADVDGTPERYVGMLGNLTLMSRSGNSCTQDAPYSQKRAVYAKENLYFTSAIAERLQVGKNTAINKAGAALITIENLNPTAIRARQSALAKLALDIWAMPRT